MKSIILICCVIYYIPAVGTVLLNSSYDVSRELFEEINRSFIEYWKTIYPEDILIIRQSHAGSTRQAIAILQGLRADVVTYNQVVDVQALHDRSRLIPKDWQDRLPNRSSPFYSTMSFLVREGNPKKIRNWNDLTKTGLKIVFPNPKTSGNGRYTYLAAWYAFWKDNNKSIEKTRSKMRKFLKNVVVFDTGGRASTATFVDRIQGDVLINFESESRFIQNQCNVKGYEVIIPNPNILVEFPVTWIDKNVYRNGTENVARAYLNYLYTSEAQRIINKFGYRTFKFNSIDLDYKKLLDDVELFKIEDLYAGGWKVAMETHFKRGGELDCLLSGMGYD